MSKIYLAGPMTGIDDWNRDAFNKAEWKLTKQGHTVWNPAYHPDGFEHGQYLKVCEKIVEICDVVYMLKGWENSVGATHEFNHAVKTGKQIWMEE